VKHVPAQPLLDSKRLDRDARTEAARAGRPRPHQARHRRRPEPRAQFDQERVRLDADRRIQASRDVMTVLDMIDASSGGVKVEGRPVTVLVVLFVHNIFPVENI
jgi:hypothetical protein